MGIQLPLGGRTGSTADEVYVQSLFLQPQNKCVFFEYLCIFELRFIYCTKGVDSAVVLTCIHQRLGELIISLRMLLSPLQMECIASSYSMSYVQTPMYANSY